MSARRPLHVRDAKTPQRENSVNKEDEPLNNESQQQITSDSGSDEEGLDYTYIHSAEENAKREMSSSVPSTPQRPKRATTATESNMIKHIPQTKALVTEGFFKMSLIKTCGIIAACVGCVVYYALFQQTGNNNAINTQRNCSYEKLQQQYTEETTFVWRTLKVGIESILNNRTESPGVYLFVHHGGEHVYRLVKDIAAHSSFCFGQEMRPIEMESDDFIASDKDYGHAIEKYKMRIKEGNVILIANLNEIPAEAARSLHTICDTHSPIAKDVVIFLTLTIPKIVDGNVESNVEDTLIQLWGSTLEPNELDPLITRVTDQVIALQS